MLPTIYEVTKIQDGTLSVMAKPVPGEWIEDEFSGLKRLGIDRIVSLLEDFEQIEIGLGSEEELCRKNGMEYTSFPIPDRGLPNTDAAKKLATKLHNEICAGKHVVIHCRAGIGRTGIIAGSILVESGITADDALSLISKVRGVQVPDTEEQVQWLKTL